ncbi:MAG: efflux RND transporter periplasmic adaptor subunit [Gammaproteobacteria bacterium]|nr:efflux RND transporter periplasmic adaptor subunit [Gammaproteobacteria bacterium]
MNIRATVSKKPWILAAAVLGVLALWMVSGIFQKPELKDEASQVAATSATESGTVPVQVERLSAELIERTVDVYGRTAPARRISLAAETEGRVEAINAARGKLLRKGDPILTLDLRDRQARLRQAEASVREHETAYRAQESLQAEGYVSETEIAATLAKLENARAELLRARIDLNNRIIRAPFDGFIETRDVENGDFVRSGDQVATFVDNLTLIVTGSLAEKDVAFISVGDKAVAKLITGQEARGFVRYVSPVADESTRTFGVELEIDNSNGELPAGVTAQMALNGGEVLAFPMSPAMLSLNSEGEIGVMTVDNASLAKFVPVTIEKSTSSGVWVSGLGDAATVITVGQGFVRTGQPVEILNPQPRETALAAETPQ